ncbi:terminase large subunit domain-containing protein [Klebsiella pneumoniae]|uniref:terminase large subunit domain-containing protein n=1 Tax=Klebsiella pneumoniae TaxID=573 RepID=UPI003F6CB56D
MTRFPCTASKTQAYVFREYIIQFARRVDVDLTGDPIVIGNNGATADFSRHQLKRRAAQGHTGDLFCRRNLPGSPTSRKPRKVSSGMASQSHLRSTYFSTPSTPGYTAPTRSGRGGIIRPGPRQRQRAG